jgi:4-methyl-5(b-hydroxyethyl)-thiazole monophosphate biosynthesis
MFRNRRNNVLWFGSRRLFSAKKIVLTQTKWRINGMKKVGIFMADGCEEIEGLTVVDIVRRAKLEMTTISITDEKEVTSSHNVTFLTDALASEVDFDGFDAIVLPGGMPGTLNLGASDMVNKVIKKFAGEGKIVAAICAAPSVLGAAGLLEGRHATCHPGFEEKLTGAITSEDAVVVDGNIITSRGMGTAIDFGLAIVDCLTDFDEEVVEHVKKGIVYRNFEEV